MDYLYVHCHCSTLAIKQLAMCSIFHWRCRNSG